MVAKTIDLVINTSRGEKNVKQLHQLARQVEKVFGNINKLKINIKTDPAQRAIKRLNYELIKGKEIVNSFMDNKSINNFGNKISGIKQEMGLVRKAFDDSVKATERQRAATTLLAGNFKALRLEATAFAMASGADPSKTIGSVDARLKTIEAFPRTILAGNEAMSMLKRMQEMTIVGSEEFLKISKAIGRQLGINANIQKQAARAAKPFTATTAFVTQAQTEALAGKTLVPPSRRLPAAGETSSKFLTPTTMQKRVARQRIDSSSKVLKNEKAITDEAKKQASMVKKTAARRLRNIRRIRRGRTQGRMLGAGFPMLFGGGAGAVGGSLAGSLLAPPGMEFGAQIFGSAIGTQLEAVHNRVVEIGNATQTLNLEALEQSGIRVNAELELQIRHLKKIGDFQKAQEAINKQVFWTTGAWGDVNKDIANNVGALKESWDGFLAAAGTTLGVIVAPFLTVLTGILKLTQGILWTLNVIFSFFAKIYKEVAKFLLALPMGGKILATIEKHMENMNGQLDGMKVKYGEIMQDLEAEKEAILLRIKYGEQEAAIRQRIKDLSHLAMTDQQKKDLDYAIRQVAALEKQEEAVKRLRDLYKTLGQTIEDGLVNAIQAAIDGTKTLGQVASSVFRELSRALIRFGVNALIGGIFSSGPTKTVTESVKPPSAAGLSLGSSFDTSDYGGGFDTSKYGKFASGGRPPVGRPSVVGEKGPELFMPDRAGTIIPNHALGSTNIAINVDASGSSVEGDEQKGRELGQMLSAAIQSELIKQRRPGGLLT